VLRTFWSVVLPTAKPALITLTTLSFQGSWNEFSYTVVSVPDPGKRLARAGTRSSLARRCWPPPRWRSSS